VLVILKANKGWAPDMDFGADDGVRGSSSTLQDAIASSGKGQLQCGARSIRRAEVVPREETFMAMTMTGEATLPAARPKVWALLNDPAVLKACIPGCESLERTGDNGFTAVAKMRIGPVAATFKGKVMLSDIVPNVGYTITGEGEGGVAGFAKGSAKVLLSDVEGGTLLHYDVDANVGGKIAQLGSRLIDGVAKNMADKFFASFAEAAGGGAAAAAAAPAAEAVAAATGPVASAAPQASLIEKSWFRRIWEWFMSR
jgi:uncharacterized protein